MNIDRKSVFFFKDTKPVIDSLFFLLYCKFRKFFRVLFSHENKFLAKWQNHSVVYYVGKSRLPNKNNKAVHEIIVSSLALCILMDFSFCLDTF